MPRDLIDFVDLANQRGYATTSRPYAAADGGPFAELAKADPRLLDVLAEIRIMHASSSKECPIRMWNGDDE